jgi:hypothetical protein
MRLFEDVAAFTVDVAVFAVAAVAVATVGKPQSRNKTNVVAFVSFSCSMVETVATANILPQRRCAVILWPHHRIFHHLGFEAVAFGPMCQVRV